MSTQAQTGAGKYVMVRIPRDLARKVDDARDLVSREAWVRRAVERDLQARGKPAKRSAKAPDLKGLKRASELVKLPADKNPYRCPRPGCESRYDKPGFKCTTHDEALVLPSDGLEDF